MLCYVCIVLDFIISMMSIMSIMIIIFIITIIMIIIIIMILMILIVIILYIYMYIYSIYSKYQGKYLRILDDQKSVDPIGRFHPGRLQLGILPTYVNVDLATVISGDSRMEPRGRRPQFEKAFSWCKYPLVNIQKAIEHGHL